MNRVAVAAIGASLALGACTPSTPTRLPVNGPMRVALARAHVTMSAPRGKPTLPLAKAVVLARQQSGGVEITQTFLATVRLQRMFDPAPPLAA